MDAFEQVVSEILWMSGIWVRTSVKVEETENQLVQLREFAAKQNWQITLQYIDRETGGTSDPASPGVQRSKR
jgi:DNA invertase Pin-like site-specific DNA recombinase